MTEVMSEHWEDDVGPVSIFLLMMQWVLFCNVLFNRIECSDNYNMLLAQVQALGAQYWSGQHIFEYFE